MRSVVDDPAHQVEFLRLHMLRQPIDVLVQGPLPLPPDTTVLTLAAGDAVPVRQVVAACGLPWSVDYCRPRGRHRAQPCVREAERAFLRRCLGDPQWRGDGAAYPVEP